MALMKKHFSEIPSDAVILTEDEAVEYQLKIIQGWKDWRDTWVFNHGFTILASLSAFTSIYVNNHYRLRLRLQNFGRMSSYLPVVMVPALSCAVFHQQFVTRDVLLRANCPTCLEVRAAAYQSVLSSVFPAVLAAASAIPFAIRYNTYDVPPVTQQPRAVLHLLYRLTRPVGGVLLGLMVAQGVAAALVTQQEMRAMASISGKLAALEEQG